MTDVAKIQQLMEDARKLMPLSDEWHAKCEEIEEALGLTTPNPRVRQEAAGE